MMTDKAAKEEETAKQLDAGGGSKHEFTITDCRVETVVVFLDRAEVCRCVKTKIAEGENEVILKKLSECIDKDSIRVEGKGPATISEVAFQIKHLADDTEASQSEKTKEVVEDLKKAKGQMVELEAKKARLEKQNGLLNGLADKLPQAITEGGKDTPPVNKDALDVLNSFFSMYGEHGARIDKALQDLQIEIDAVNSRIEALNKNLNELNFKKTTPQDRQLSVLLDGSEAAEVELFVSYVVTKASWSPKYDIRVFSADNIMKIMYFAMIQQATGEDWDDAKLCLSTATPSVGGNVPELSTLRLQFVTKYSHVSHYGQPKERKSVRRFGSLRKKRQAASFDHGDELRACAMLDTNEFYDSVPSYEEEAVPMETPVAQVKESVTSTMYEIARRSTIPCDNVGHKVSVAIIDLKPEFEYECVPKISAHAYLKAKVKNTSPYALLAGPTNVFLDNNFIAKAELKAVSPQEEFTCSLGVDPAVRVDYKPINKYREQSGFISKSANTTYKQVIEIKNTHQDQIKILVTDQLPLSFEEKIKVVLIEPQIKGADKPDKVRPIRLSKKNNVEWDLEIPAGQIKEIVLKYSVEHPVGDDVEFNN